MSKWSIAAKPKDEQNKVNVDLAFSGVACKMRISELWTYGKQQLVSFYEKNITSGLCFPYINRGVCS